MRVHLHDGTTIEGYRRRSSMAAGRVLLIDVVAVRDGAGTNRSAAAADEFIPACDTERVEALDTPTPRGA